MPGLTDQHVVCVTLMTQCKHGPDHYEQTGVCCSGAVGLLSKGQSSWAGAEVRWNQTFGSRMFEGVIMWDEGPLVFRLHVLVWSRRHESD